MVSQVQELEIGERPLGAVLQGSDALAEGAPVEAAVKWFNATKGYGFVELSDGRGDAFLHLKALREIGRQTLPSGAKVRVVAPPGRRGAGGVRVVEVDMGSAIERSPRRSSIDPSAA